MKVEKRLTGETQSGRPITATTSENIEEIQSIINDNPYITMEELQEQTDLNRGIIQRVISDHLSLRKITARYVPKQLTNFQRTERVRICQENLAKFESGAWRLYDVVTGDESWFYHKQISRKSSNSAWIARDDPSSTVVRQSTSSPKTLLSIFFKSTGPVWIHCVEWEPTANHQHYIDYCLKPLINNIKKQRSLCGVQGIKLHCDNQRLFVHKDVSNYLESEGITIIPHPPNSPDLSPCDFWLFDLIKQNLTDQNNSELLCRAVSNFMNSLDKEEYRKAFNKWIYRMHLCMNNDGDYFEHLVT